LRKWQLKQKNKKDSQESSSTTYQETVNSSNGIDKGVPVPVNKTENQEDSAQIKDKQSLTPVTGVSDLQMENYILKKEIKYLRKLNKAKDQLIKSLRRKV